MLRRKHFLTGVLITVLSLAGCGGGGGGDSSTTSNNSGAGTPPPGTTPPPGGGGGGGGGGSGPTPGQLVGSGSASFTLSWTPPTTNTDGSALTNLAGYRVRFGLNSGDYTDVIELDSAGLSRYVVDSVATDTYFVVMTAVNAAGIESDYSAEIAALAN